MGILHPNLENQLGSYDVMVNMTLQLLHDSWEEGFSIKLILI